MTGPVLFFVLFKTVVRRLFGDLDVVYVRFAHTGRTDFDEFGAFAHFVDGLATTVSHRGADTANQLEDDGVDAALVRNTGFDTFRNQLVRLVFGFVLEVTVCRTALHGTDTAHAAISLVTAALIEDDFAGSFIGTREHAAHHDGRCTGRQCLGDVAGETDAAVCDTRYAGTFKRFGDVGNGGNLRNTDTGDDTGGADGTRADTDLDGVRAVIKQCACRCGRSDIAADDFDIRIVRLDPFDAVQHAL